MPPENGYEPNVSIIVPVLNAEATIADLLDSIEEIDYDKQKLEVIIVDGGSTDKTRGIIRKYPVKLITEKRRGLNIARNTGFKNSRGEIILFTDSDCVIPPDWVRKTVRNFEDPRVGCVGGTVSRHGNDFLSRYADESLMPVLRRFRKREVLANVKPPLHYPAGCNMAFRRAFIEEAKGFDEQILYGFDEDELIERICSSGCNLILDREAVIKHQHRATLKSLLKQTFNYGRGGALLLKKRRAKDNISRWILISILFFMIWLILGTSFAILATVVSTVFLAPFLLMTVVPLCLLVLFYAYRGLREKEAAMPFAYPPLDVLRLFAFCIGGIYELTR